MTDGFNCWGNPFLEVTSGLLLWLSIFNLDNLENNMLCGFFFAECGKLLGYEVLIIQGRNYLNLKLSEDERSLSSSYSIFKSTKVESIEVRNYSRLKTLEGESILDSSHSEST